LKIYQITNAQIANTFFSKLIGFMFQKRPLNPKTIIFINEKMIHMFFCFFDLPILMVDKNKIIIDKFIIKPWRISKFYFKAKYIVETTDMELFNSINIGDQVSF